jgi:hypothetical protein
VMRAEHVLAGMCIAALVGCSSRADAEHRSVATTSALAASEWRAAVPKHKTWRWVPREDLERVTLWTSHLLIRHDSAESAGVPFGPEWNVLPPNPARTVEEARLLAESLADRLQAEPQLFSQLAQEYSEDSATQSRGGFLGGLSALEFALFPPVLDAIADLSVDE